MNELYHHGVLGMKWGIRRYQNADGSLTKLGRKMTKKSRRNRKSEEDALSKISNEELKTMITRLELEKKYTDLMKAQNARTQNKGAAFVKDVLAASGKNIAVQTTTYLMGATVNNIAGTTVVNPKKGQKDK